MRPAGCLLAVAAWCDDAAMPVAAATMRRWADVVTSGGNVGGARLEAAAHVARVRRLVALYEASGRVPPVSLTTSMQAHVLAKAALEMAANEAPVSGVRVRAGGVKGKEVAA